MFTVGRKIYLDHLISFSCWRTCIFYNKVALLQLSLPCNVVFLNSSTFLELLRYIFLGIVSNTCIICYLKELCVTTLLLFFLKKLYALFSTKLFNKRLKKIFLIVPSFCKFFCNEPRFVYFRIYIDAFAFDNIQDILLTNHELWKDLWNIELPSKHYLIFPIEW